VVTFRSFENVDGRSISSRSMEGMISGEGPNDNACKVLIFHVNP
jgi:hypothetical protein